MRERDGVLFNNSEKIRERFSRVPIAKSFFALLLWGGIGGIALYYLYQSFDLDQTTFELIVFYAVYAVPLLLTLWVLKWDRLPVTPVFIGEKKNLPKTAYVFILFTITISTIWVTLILLHAVDPGWAESHLNWLNSIEMFDIGDDTTFIQYFLIFGVIAVVAPIVEEIVFRGILIERLGRKFGYTSALITSSVFFGFLHVSFISATIFGLILGILYLKTRSLMLPVLIHMANNAIATFLIFTEESFDFAAWETVTPYIENAWIGILLFAAVMAWFVWFLKENWSTVTNMNPFGDQGTASSSEISDPETHQ
ncbi:CPBP family intramembrane metalloprotease [Rhodohalobacter sp. SW132]|uniref:CPBP family intramembrane glutamic endopeptidase n=1 Tax=Rhodohalobacter sp. SW132 TaxID=2293433 RepID=UPI000E279E56|nr:type II CAAX endopeptidase family protein [Rhodohalobacter sp. SW132]REL29219.1 CPBP family intramembrane metalloprotease [Rhodohalobacter sp. SW132]